MFQDEFHHVQQRGDNLIGICQLFIHEVRIRIEYFLHLFSVPHIDEICSDVDLCEVYLEELVDGSERAQHYVGFSTVVEVGGGIVKLEAFQLGNELPLCWC